MLDNRIFHPDQYFTVEQQRRLGELMASWHSSLEVGSLFSAEERDELEALVEAELHASAARATWIATMQQDLSGFKA